MSKSISKNKGVIYFVEEKDLLGYSTPNYVKIGLAIFVIPVGATGFEPAT